MSAADSLVGERSALRGWLAGLFRRNGVAYPLGYLPALDGARGLMTLGVLAAHTKMSLFGGAMVYMDVFFTMSGYLITSLLLKEYERKGTVRLGKFYLRRFMRLYPALTAMVVTVALCALLFDSNLRQRLTEAAVAWVYLANYAGHFVPDYVPQYTGHTWSLAVEEQFYLLWPLLFLGIVRLFGVSLRAAAAIFALAVLLWIWKCVQTYNGASTIYLYISFDMRADSLLIGCALAFALKCVDLSNYPRLWRAAGYALVPIFVAMLAMGFILNVGERWYFYVSPLLAAIPSAISIVGLLYPQQTAMHRLYEHAAPVFVGRICYGLYLWHFPIFAWIQGWATEDRTLTVILIGWPLAFTAAILSYYLIERPFMRARPGV